MPELPEVEIVCRGLQPVFVNKEIAHVTINRSDLRVPIPDHFPLALRRQRTACLSRRGKYIIATLESGVCFVLHLGMSGRVHIFERHQIPKIEKHDHVIWEMADGTNVVFNDPRRFGMLYLSSAEELETISPFASMGPEPLGNRFSGPILAKKLERRGGPIKTVFLDQKVVAGIGNIYACEALYKAGISPKRKASSIKGRRADRLVGALRDVLRGAIAAGGSSLKDYAHTDGSLGYFQTCLSVYDREGQPCSGCDCDYAKTGGVARIIQAGRSTFFCARQQT